MKRFSIVIAAFATIVAFGGCNDAGSSDNESTPSSVDKTTSTVKVDPNYQFTPDTTDTIAPSVLNTIPGADTSAVSPNSSIVMYFDDIINPSSISASSVSVLATDAAAVAANRTLRSMSSKTIFGTISIMKSSNGKGAIIVFTPYDGFPVSSVIELVLSGNEILDKGGNKLSQDYTVSFNTGTVIASSIDEFNFEKGTTGMTIQGQGGIVTMPKWGVPAISGDHAAAITTSSSSSISDSELTGNAMKDQCSTLTSGLLTVPSGKTIISVDYYFISDEFKEYLGTKYDDNATMTVSGTNGSKTLILNSVNDFVLTKDDLVQLSINPSGSTDGYWRGALTTKSIDISGLGDSVSVSFSVSDVGDTAVNTILLFDNVRFE